MEQIEAEEHELLVASCFDFESLENLPYGPMVMFLQSYTKQEIRLELYKTAESVCNDSFKSPLCLYYHPKVIAAACI